MKYLKGKKVTGLTAQLKCLYTNACSMGNKQEELKATVLRCMSRLAVITYW